jgi:predicted ATPase/DNA-binding SARP family transcriptional activator
MRLSVMLLKIRLGRGCERGRRGRTKGLATIDFRILGPVQAYDDGVALALGAPKQRAVLAELLLARGAVVPRERLVDAVWGEDAPESSLSSLQVYVHGLRKSLGGDRIETHGSGYRVALDPEELDLGRFERAVERGRSAFEGGEPGVASAHLREALSLWGGPPLADLAEHPVGRRAAELEDRRLRAVELRNDVELALGRHAELLAELAALVAGHPYRERLREQLVVALYRAGRQKEALDAYRDARRTLADELGVEPGPALRELERAVLRHDPALAAPHAPAAAETRLPAPPTPLVGRRLETAAVAALLRRDDVRLVTLTGPGGTGKTRLALAAAAELAPELAGGARFVDLAPVTDPGLVADAIAQALGVGQESSDPFAAVVEAVGGASTLLVLDNLEQLLPDVPVVPELLAAVPRLRILATSRAPLRLSAEHEYPVPPLPAPAAGARFEELVANDAVRLFAARVQAVDHGFVLDDGNIAAVAAICRRLDGLPLALELAAARVRVLAPAELERRLGGALGLLVAGARDLPPRQRTLRATLDWSHELLDPGERTALACLAVFAGGCTAEAAEAVIGGGDALGRLEALAESSLLRRVERPGGGARFLLLETIRAYALERLREAGEEAGARARHAAHFLELTERIGEQLLRSPAEEPLREIDAEHENVLAALAWAAESGDVETEVRLAVALRPYWAVRGELAEARRLFEHAIAHSGHEPALHARALVHGAVFAYRAGDSASALAEWQEARELFASLGDDEEVARCTAELGAVAMAEGDLDRAEELWREAVAAFAAQGNRLREAMTLANLACVVADRGDPARAVEEGQRALAMQREIEENDGIAVSVLNLGRWTLGLGETDAARAYLAEALELGRRLGYREVIGYGLGNAAEIALRSGDPETSARLLGAYDAVFEATGVARAADELDRREQLLAEVGERLGRERTEELLAAGSALPPETAVAEALRAIA